MSRWRTRGASYPSSASRAPCGRRRRRCQRRWWTRPMPPSTAATPTASPSRAYPSLPRARERSAPGAASPGPHRTRTARVASTCRSRSAGPDGRTVLLAGWRDGARPGRRDRPARRCRELAAARARARAGAARAAGGDGAAPVARTAADVPAPQPRAAHPAHRDHRVCHEPAAQDVTWDADSQQRFLSRIAAESARLGRLVNDLLDFSTIESGILRLNSDWCDIPLVLDAAVAVLPREAAEQVRVVEAAGLPTIWADHDRLEQVSST